MSSPSRRRRHFPRGCCPGSSCLSCWYYRSSSSNANRLYCRRHSDKLRTVGYTVYDGSRGKKVVDGRLGSAEVYLEKCLMDSVGSANNVNGHRFTHYSKCIRV